MKINQIIPTNSLDSFRLPKSPLIDKNINPIEDSPNFDASPSSFFPKTTNNDRNLPPIHQNSDSLETDSFQSPANNKNNYNSKFYYQYFKKMVDESQKEQNSQEINTFDEEENEYTEEKIENLYEELINKPFPEENFNLYVTKRPIFDLLTLYSDPYPLLTIRKQTLFIK